VLIANKLKEFGVKYNLGKYRPILFQKGEKIPGWMKKFLTGNNSGKMLRSLIRRTKGVELNKTVSLPTAQQTREGPDYHRRYNFLQRSGRCHSARLQFHSG